MGLFDDIEQVGKVVDKVGNAIDRNTESGEERQEALNKRHSADMMSDSWLSKNIRPLIALLLFLSQMIIFVAMFMEVDIPTEVSMGVSGLLATAIGFYFSSRGAEKVMAKKAIAAIKIEQIRTKANIKQAKVLNRQERREKRKDKNEKNIE